MFKENRIFKLCAIGTIFSLSLSAYATTNPHIHNIVAPQCLIKGLKGSFQTLSEQRNFVLLETDDAGIDWLIDAKVKQQKSFCGGFVDVTEEWQAYPKDKNAADHFLKSYTANDQPEIHHSYTIQYQKQVNELLSQMNAQNLWDNLTVLSSYKDRYANSDNGVKAANWLKAQIEGYAKDNHRNDVTVEVIPTGTSYKQPSVVAKFGTSSAPGVVIGAHMDTLNSNFSVKPGADDDGTGSVTVLETARTILASGMDFKNPIYFIWYAAEEEGLVGSGYVVSEFKNRNIPVNAVIHFDMTGYAYKNDSTIWLLSDNTNKDLTSYLDKLVATYVKKPVKYTQCGYACSDHANWNKKGYPASCPFESSLEHMNQNIHTNRDTMDKLSLQHMTDFAKLAIAFTTELAEPVSK